MDKEICICTIISKNYLAQARTIAQSFKQYNKGKIFVLLVDKVDGYFDPEKELFELIYIEDLKSKIPNFDQFCFKYNILELNTAVKPFYLEYLFEKYNLEKLVYFDPDILITNTLSDLSSKLDEFSVVLTPHIIEPYKDFKKPNEIDLLKAGIYNLGFIAMKNDDETKNILSWWKDRLYSYCLVDVEKGLFVDQKWANFIPCFSDNILILRDKTYNIAYWNLHYINNIEIINGEYYLEKEKVNFFHFSGYNPEDNNTISKHQNRFGFNELNNIKQIYNFYGNKLFLNGYRDIKKWSYFYGYYNNNEKINDADRKQYRLLNNNIKEELGNPFIVDKKSSFYELIKKDKNVMCVTESLEQENIRLKGEINAILNSRTYRWGHKISIFASKIIPPFTKRRKIAVSLYKITRRIYKKFNNIFYYPYKIVSFINQCFVFLTKKIQYFLYEKKYKNTIGINIFGYLISELGVGESARLLIRSIFTTKISFKILSVDSHANNRKKDFSIFEIAKLSKINPYRVNLFVVNADQTKRLFAEESRNTFEGKYNIGYWAWELNNFPDIWIDSFSFYNEIWTPSEFIAQSLRLKTSIPVIKLPMPVKVEKIKDVGLEYFNFNKNLFTFFFMFDFHSEFERKNPLAIIQSFKMAFSKKDHVQLIIKSSNNNYDPDNYNKMKSEALGYPIYFIDQYLSKEDLDTLTSLCDCYVSLHRGEGYGLSLAEAMYLGKPVIATNYSGNTEFMNKENSYLVDYKMEIIKKDAGPYKSGQTWADPDISHATNLMRYVYDNKEKVKKVGKIASDDIKKYYSFEYIGEKMKERIDFIYKNNL